MRYDKPKCDQSYLGPRQPEPVKVAWIMPEPFTFLLDLVRRRGPRP